MSDLTPAAPPASPPPARSLTPPPGTPVFPACVWGDKLSVEEPHGWKTLLLNHSFFMKVLVVSIIVHVVVMCIHFSPVLRKQWNQHQMMEVVLVNSKTKEAPTKAEVLAQANLDGGGNTDADRRVKTPLPKLPKQSQKTELAAAVEKRQELERKVRELVAQEKTARTAVVPPPEKEVTPPPVPEAPPRPDATQLVSQSMEMMQLEAQIQKEMDAYQKRPRKHFVGSRAEEYRFARYIEDWRLKVERIGNQNYPEAARRQQLYGSLTLTVAIKNDGSIHEITIDRSSGHRILDAAAQKIVEMGAPYAAFPADIKRDIDILYITRTWSFTRGSGLETRYAPR